jgi:hypothetical protein
MAIKTIRVFAEYTSDGYVPMPSQGNIDYGITIGNSFPETQPSSYQTDDPNIDVAVNTMTDFYVWIRTHGSPWNPSYTRVVRVYPDSPSINSVVMNMIVAVGSGGTSINAGGGVTYYLNGGTSQGVLDGSTYYEMSKTPVEGAMVDFFKINTTGFQNIAQFVTDAGDPSLLKIPPGAWPLGFYFSASDNSGSPKFYAEIYKYSEAGVFTLLGSSVASAEVISNGVAIDYYTTTVTIPDTTLLITDRIAIRIFVDTDGNRTVNFHTQDSHLASVGTTFANGLTAINGLTKQVQFITIGNAGSDAAIVSSDDTHTINLPTASATKRGLLNNTDWSTFNSKQAALSGTGFVKIDGSTISYDNSSYQPLDGDLTAIGALAGNTGILKKTGANTWELDTTTYLSTGVAADTYQRKDKMVSNLLASDTEYPNSNAVLAKLALKADIANPQFTGSMNIKGAESRINFYDETDAIKYFIGYDSGFLRIYQSAGSASRFYINLDGKTFIPGIVEAGTIIKTGGTASQFLKADGSVDANTYITSGSLSNYLLSATAASTYQRLDKMVSNLLASDTEYPNSNAVLAKLALKADAANPVFTGDMTISGIAPKLYFTDTDNNPDYTLFVDSGYFYIYDQTAGATRFSINPSGNISTGIGKTITTSGLIVDKVSGVSTITFPAGTNDPGFIQHIEITPNTGIMRFSVGDDNDSNDYFAFGNNNVPDAFRINAMGTVSIGVWQATAIADAYIASASTWNAKQNAITLTTTGSSGAATFTSNTLNIPNYGSALSGYLPLTGGTLTGTLNGTIVNTSSYSRFYNVGVGGAASGTYAAYSDAVIGFANLHLVASTGGAVYVNSALALPFYINPVGGNVMIGTTTDLGYKINVEGTGRFSSNLYTATALYINTTSAYGFKINSEGNNGFYNRGGSTGSHYPFLLENSSGSMLFQVLGTGAATFSNSVNVAGEIQSNSYIQSKLGASGTIGLGSRYQWDNNASGASQRQLALQMNANYGLDLFYYNGSSYDNIGISFASNGSIYSGRDFRTDLGTVKVGAGSNNYYTQMSTAYIYPYIDSYFDSVAGASYEGRIIFRTSTGGGSLSAKMSIYNNGNVLIGTTTDAGYKLDVNGSARIVGNVNYSSSSALYPRTTSVTDWYLCKHNASGDRIENALGTNNPFTLGNHIGSTYTANIFLYGGGWATFNSSVTATAFFESSDGRLKTLIDESAQISGIENLQAKLYEKNGKIELGYFAQDAEKLMPYAVTKNADGFLNLSYREIHTAKISRLEKRVAELEKQLNLN